MAIILGIDTSNYTTSCALFDTESNSIVKRSRLLPVKDGERGIRQSDAVFHHTVRLSGLLESLLAEYPGRIDAVCASSTPRMQEGSYMPCFLVGVNTARSISAAVGVPYFETSHQHGHIAAALFSADKLELADEKFIAFHISGGTTEGIIVSPDEHELFAPSVAAKTLDLNAGQLIDRVGVRMGLTFPCGKELERLALSYTGEVIVGATVRDHDCSLSGYENKLVKMFEDTGDKAKTAMHTLMTVEKTVSKMAERLIEKYGELPLVFAGGVMSNSIIRSSISRRFTSYFAEPDYSCDNAAGVAIIGGYKYRKQL